MPNKGFPERLKQLRESHEMTLEELAERLAISKSLLWDLEQGRRRVHGKLLQDIADHFDVSVDYLLGRTDGQKDLVDPDIRIISRAAQKMSPDERKEMVDMLKDAFKKAFGENEKG